jgi:hypothetical protein
MQLNNPGIYRSGPQKRIFGHFDIEGRILLKSLIKISRYWNGLNSFDSKYDPVLGFS